MDRNLNGRRLVGAVWRYLRAVNYADVACAVLGVAFLLAVFILPEFFGFTWFGR